MKLIRGLANLSNIDGCVATIGNFDGVHLAHQDILKNLNTLAKAKNLPTVVISFYPNPRKFFGKKITELSSFKDRFQILDNLGIDFLLLIHFNKAFASIHPDDFITGILMQKLGVEHLLIGDDFLFGKNRSGDFSLLNQYLNTTAIDEFLYNNTRVSSSNIRKCLAAGDITTASNMLGRQFSISGRVIYGRQLGRTIGFPTANISIKQRNLPICGVFATDIVIDEIVYKSIANIGVKPTINGDKKTTLEVHIFDFNADIYNKEAEVRIIRKIRDEQKFNSLEELKMQITSDIATCKNNS